MRSKDDHFKNPGCHFLTRHSFIVEVLPMQLTLYRYRYRFIKKLFLIEKLLSFEW